MPTTLVFGASLKPNRYSNLVVKRLLEHNITTVAFGLRPGLIDSVQIKTNLDELPKVDIVTLYLGAERQKQYYESIIGLKPKKVIFNPGTENPEFYDMLAINGVEVEVACTLVLLSTGQY
ncbi:CoA-binding protein [Croceitalea sp. MTPC5]|uniref:CoA-binding protein n=1 Tax=Croceitalea sp. MTPC5 TaxID=3056565 RepID=UPI002B37ED85|nr:CoA-binding protein [Croceitalea sp. MTPC5]